VKSIKIVNIKQKSQTDVFSDILDLSNSTNAQPVEKHHHKVSEAKAALGINKKRFQI